MKYLKLFESFEDIDSICRKYEIEDYIINEDGTIDVDDDVNLSEKGFKKLPLKFRNVSGSFDCSDNGLTSLEGCPQSVGGNFSCRNNQLKSLEGCPQNIGGAFFCVDNHLHSLEGIGKVSGDIYCGLNPCFSIYKGWINTDRREMLLDLMEDYDFLRGEEIYWGRLEAFYKDSGLIIPNKRKLEKYYKIIE